jgi:hypothetical protein
MNLKSLLAAAALLSSPALLAGPAAAADWDGHRHDRGYSESRYDRDDDWHGHRHYDRRPRWAHRKPWHWRKWRRADRYYDRFDRHDDRRDRRRDW